MQSTCMVMSLMFIVHLFIYTDYCEGNKKSSSYVFKTTHICHVISIHSYSVSKTRKCTWAGVLSLDVCHWTKSWLKKPYGTRLVLSVDKAALILWLVTLSNFFWTIKIWHPYVLILLPCLPGYCWWWSEEREFFRFRTENSICGSQTSTIVTATVTCH